MPLCDPMPPCEVIPPSEPMLPSEPVSPDCHADCASSPPPESRSVPPLCIPRSLATAYLLVLGPAGGPFPGDRRESARHGGGTKERSGSHSFQCHVTARRYPRPSPTAGKPAMRHDPGGSANSPRPLSNVCRVGNAGRLNRTHVHVSQTS